MRKQCDRFIILFSLMALIWLGMRCLDAQEESPVITNESLHDTGYHLGRRADLSDATIKSNRQLSDADLQVVLEYSDFAMDVQNKINWRIEAVRCLGRLGHRHAIGALAAILRDENDDVNVRRACAEALGGINDLKVVDIFISQLHEQDLTIWSNMQWILKGLKGTPESPRPRLIARPKSKDEWVAYQKRWKEWWEKNRDFNSPASLRKSHFAFHQAMSGWPPRSFLDGE